MNISLLAVLIALPVIVVFIFLFLLLPRMRGDEEDRKR